MEKDRHLDELVQNVPLPSEIPVSPDLSHLPTHILRSGAVETLIQQNDDLMARLSVSLRRISSLEEQLVAFETENKEMRTEYDSFKDQVLILREKARVLGQRKNNEEEVLNNLRDEIQLREIQYAELFSASKEKQEVLGQQADRLSKKVSRYFRYRRRIHEAADRLREKHREAISELREENRTQREVAKNELAELDGEWTEKLQINSDELNEKLRLRTEELDETRARVTDLEESLQSMETQYHQEVAAGSKFKKDLGDAAEHIQALSKENRENQNRLTDEYEAQLREKEEVVKEREAQIAELETKISDYNELYEKSVEQQNQVVMVKRQLDEAKIQYETEISDLQKSLARYRGEAKTKTLELENTKKDLVNTHNEFISNKKANDELTEQVENLQCLWRENQSELEKQKEKNTALQNMNKQLSLKMNDYRQQIHDLKRVLDSAQVYTAQKVQELKSQVKAVTAIQQSELVKKVEASEGAESAPAKLQPEIADKIDSLIGEIHTAFNSSANETKEQD